MHPKYSIVIPVYNRPNELCELLDSLCNQQYKNFEVIIVEDGSTVGSEDVIRNYTSKLTIQYYFKNNSGPGPSRNFGFEKSKGDYLVTFDSDCILPESYFTTVEQYLQQHSIDAWGGPDKGHHRFSDLQQAMAHTMSSFLTTGGIRGGKKQIGKFQPRSFNMAISRTTFELTNGFHFDKMAEDIELSVRMKKLNLNVHLIQAAYVFHKRRSTSISFFFQTANFGRGRVLVGVAHPGEVKWVHWFPTFFLLGLVSLPIIWGYLPTVGTLITMVYLFYLSAIFVEGWIKTKSFKVALLCIPSGLVQLIGYGLGFLFEKIRTSFH